MVSSATQVVKVPNGGTIAVRTGLLRGAGPQGPMGPQGPAGPQGVGGIQGPAGQINALLTRLTSSAAVATSSDKWYPVTMDTRGQDDLLVPGNDGLNLQFQSAITCLLVAVVQFETTHAPSSGGVAGGARRLRWVDASGSVLNGTQFAVEAAHNEPTIAVMMNVISPDPSRFYHLEAQSRDDLGVTVTNRYVTLIQVGAGPPGPLGPPGPVGSTGPQGATGAAGSASSGYGTYNAISAGSPDTTVAPANVAYLTSADQGLRTPTGTTSPFTPYYLQRLALDIEPKLVSRYSTSAARSAARASRQPGEITYLNSTGAIYHRELNSTDLAIARVVQSSSAPPSGSGQASPGVIWIQTS